MRKDTISKRKKKSQKEIKKKDNRLNRHKQCTERLKKYDSSLLYHCSVESVCWS